MNTSIAADEVYQELVQRVRPVDLDPLPENPKVSVLIGNYNYADFIAEAIESVLQQSYSNFELIVCDDGSTDQSCNVILQYANRDARVRLIRQANAGQACALNTAYRESSGEILCLMDSDDRYLPEKLETVVRGFRSNPDSGFLAHKIFPTDREGRRVGLLPPLWDPPSGWYGELVLRTGDPPPGLVPTSGLCMRREVADLIFPLPKKMTIGADTAVSCLAPLTTRLVGERLPLAEYRYHDRNGFAPPRVNAEVLQKLLDCHRSSWSAQRDYITRISPALVEIFPPLEARLGYQLASYVLARLTHDSGMRQAHRAVMENARFSSTSVLLRWFWALSIWLPLPVFQRAVNWMWVQRSPSFLGRLFYGALRFLHRRRDRT